MKKITILQRYLIILLLLPLTGCQKLIDRIFHHHTSDTGCLIAYVKIQGNNESRTGTFYYNLRGDLDSVVFDTRAGSVGSQFFYFEYDEHHRLIAYNGFYDREPDNYYFKHKYIYSDQGWIIEDTARIRQAGSWTQVTTLEYDNKGRVIRETGKVIEAEGDSTVHETLPREFEYDEHGNLTGMGPYDDKINYLSTREVLMFTERNYSKNNPLTATGYNEQGLPLGFSTGGVGLLQIGPPSEIIYSCGGEWDY